MKPRNKGRERRDFSEGLDWLTSQLCELSDCFTMECCFFGFFLKKVLFTISFTKDILVPGTCKCLDQLFV